jgi:RimJ/RimL family protein N-acetyltransferase
MLRTENEGAWNVYERAGFMHTATKEEGPIGKERLYYLDLDNPARSYTFQAPSFSVSTTKYK